VSHPNATLTPRTRLRLARLIVEQGWTCTEAAKMFMVAAKTARKWADRYRTEGMAGMTNRSCRPHHSPNRTPAPTVRQIVRLRWRKRLGPVQIGGRLGLPASTVHAVLVRCRINRLSRIDRVTGEPLRRYEHDHPGSLIHVDVTKFGNIPDGGGWRYVGKQQGDKNGALDRSSRGPRSCRRRRSRTRYCRRTAPGCLATRHVGSAPPTARCRGRRGPGLPRRTPMIRYCRPSHHAYPSRRCSRIRRCRSMSG
jgi:transposase-like protein